MELKVGASELSFPILLHESIEDSEDEGEGDRRVEVVP